MHSKLVFCLLANFAGPPMHSLINQLSHFLHHLGLILDLSGLIDFEEILAATARIAFFQSILNEMGDNFDLFEDKGTVKLLFIILSVSFFALNTDKFFARYAGT